MSLFPPTANIHIVKHCNYRCAFCFAHFHDAGGALPFEVWKTICHDLLANGVRKINFAGGEPTLYPRLGDLIEFINQSRGVSSIVTNGSRLRMLLDRPQTRPHLVGLSVDSSSDQVNTALGRGKGGHATQTLELASEVRALGLRLKINTVVTRLILAEDMSGFIASMRPERWKLFQVLPILGENDGKVEKLLVTEAEFLQFVRRHRALSGLGIEVVPETNNDMTGSYMMIDPDGCFFDNSTGRLKSSRPIFDVGIAAAWDEVQFSRKKFDLRGGDYR